MFGREYSHHVDILTHSLGEINENYQDKIKANNNRFCFIDRLKKLYISIFGIPEIGFQIRNLYFEKILNTQLLKKNPKKILDAGCGIGSYTLSLGKMFAKAKVMGGDIDKYKLQSCRAIAAELNIKNTEFKYLNIVKVNIRETYDLIVCIDVLEHIRDYDSVLKNFSKLLNNGGYLYIHVPQPNQKRIFSSLKKWHHEDHAHEGITKNELADKLRKLGFDITVSMETFGLFGKLAWEINHIALSKNFVLAGAIFPFIYPLALLDLFLKNKNGLGVALLSQKK